MIHLNLVQSQIDAAGQVQTSVIGEVWAEGHDLTIDPPDAISRELALVSLRTGEPIRVEQDAEEWARSLAGSLRGVGMAVEILQDTNPVPEAADTEEDFELPDEASVKTAIAGY